MPYLDPMAYTQKLSPNMVNTENGNHHSQQNSKTVPPTVTRSSLVVRDVSSDDSFVVQQARRKLELAQTLKVGLIKEDKIRDRRWRDFKVYKNSFLHDDAIAWLMENNKLTQEEAVEAANELVDMHYVTHVCNDHRFAVNESKTLFFKFREDIMEADLQSLTRKQDQSIIMDCRQEVSTLKTKVERLAVGNLEIETVAREAYSKIAMLEAIVVSLGFSIAVLTFIIFAMLLDGTISHDTFGDMKFLITCLVAVLVPVTLIGYRTAWMDRVGGDVALMRRLFATYGSLDGAIAMDMESDDGSAIGDRQVQLQRESMIAQMIHSLSMPRKEPMKIRDASDLPDVATWPHRPALLCANTPVSPSLYVPEFGTGPCPIGVPFEFSTELFEGTCLVRLRDVPSDDPDGDAEYFDGRKRRFQSIVQGRFKEELAVSDVFTGHEFLPLKRLPPSWLVRAATSLISRIAPGTDIVLNKQETRAMSLLAATSQVVSIDPVGNEPEITNGNIEEDVSLFGGIFASGDVSIYKRKHYLANPKHAAKYRFDTDSIYTFDFYQNLLDVGTYSLDLGFKKIGLAKFLDGQPIQVMSKTSDGRYLWNFQVWHEKLLPKSTTESATQ
jgi:hypothetical protein